MRIITRLIAGFVLSSVCLADPASPFTTNLLSDIGNLDIKADQWTLSKGVLSKNSPLYHGDMLLIAKKAVVTVPLWYSLGCDLVNIQKQNDKLPVAGLIFGFVDERNYWSLTIDEEFSSPILKLVHTKNGEMVTETSAPLTIKPDEKAIALSLEVHHQIYVKVRANKSLVLTHKVSGGIERGQVGLTLQSGICNFATATISGIAKR